MVYGYTMARVAGAERLMLPVLDILQIISVLGFCPGLCSAWSPSFPRETLGSKSPRCR